MSKIFTLLSGLLLPLAALAYTPEQTQLIKTQAAHPLRYALRAGKPDLGLYATAETQKRAQPITPDLQLGKNNSYGFIEAPDGSIWSYSADFEITETQISQYYTEKAVTGFSFTIHDNTGKELGTIKDKIRFEGSEIKVADIALDATVTKKFFNLDENYEIIVCVAYNNPDYTVSQRSYVYSLGATAGADGCTEPVYKYDGYIVAAQDMNPDRWSENYYLSVLTETPYDESAQSLADFAASKIYKVTTYRKGGYGSSEPVPFHTFEVSAPNLPGDQMSVPFFMTGKLNGRFIIVTSQYEKWFFSNAIGPGVDDQGNINESEGMPFTDNNLVVSLYSYTGYGDATLEQQTKIAADQTDPSSDVLFRYYSVGNLQNILDVLENGNLNICIQKYLRSNDDEYLLTFSRYDRDGNHLFDLAQNVNSVLAMSDLPGQEPQVMFVKLNESPDQSAAPATFTFVDILSGTTVSTLSSIHNEWSLRANVDRALNPDGTYSYLFQTNDNYMDQDGSIVEQLLWIKPDGHITTIDRINLGQDIAMAQVYISSEALSPYLFNTDAHHEYMWLVKRYTGEGTVANTELLVANTQGRTIFTQGPDAQMGNLLSIVLLNTDSTPSLMISFADENSNYSQCFYNLPMEKFTAGGDGSPENPYLISTIGDFSQIRQEPGAHYRLVSDIDASGYNFQSIKPDFTGTLDGASHTITGLSLDHAIFNGISGNTAQIKDLSFRGVTMTNPTGSTDGILTVSLLGGTVSGVHFNGLSVNGPDANVSFGVIAGRASLYSTITGCSVTSADIYLPMSDDVAGIVSSALTGSQITCNAVIATIEGHTSVGGIVASVGTDVVISDCHADVDLTAMNTVGGIAASVQDATVQRCYTEGSITTKGSTYVYVDFGPCAGGIVGILSSAPEPEGTITEEDCAVKNNFVNMTAINAYTSSKPEAFPGQHDTMHRIVGRTQANETPDISGYDGSGNPVYNDPYGPDKRLFNNYAAENLAPGSETIAPEKTSTEGATVPDSELNQKWFADNLGFSYGLDMAWNPATSEDPALSHETGTYCTPQTLVVEEGDYYDITVVFVSRHAISAEDAIDSFFFTCDETVTTMTGDFTYAHNALTVEFEALSVGETTVDLCGAKCLVKVVERGLGNISDSVADTTDTPVITVDATGVHAPGCLITLYSVTGTPFASGNSHVTVDTLQPGIYLAHATNTAGHTATRKFIIK